MNKHSCKNCDHDALDHVSYYRKFKCSVKKCKCKDYVKRHFVYVSWYTDDEIPRINGIYKTRQNMDDDEYELGD